MEKVIFLNDNGVVFTEDPRAYWYTRDSEGNQLPQKEWVQHSGISGIYSKTIQDEYAAIPQEVLDKAATKGTKVHNDCEIAFRMGVATTTQSKNFLKIVQENSLQVLEMEYIVTDKRRFSSPVDMVATSPNLADNEVYIIDLKTTYKIMEESVTWQTSILANMFELCNPHLKVAGVFVLWLRDSKYKFQELKRAPEVEAWHILDCAELGLPYSPLNLTTELTLTQDAQTKLIQLQKLETIIAEHTIKLKELQADADILKSFLLEEMEANGITKWETESLTVSYKKGYIRNGVDKDALELNYPEIYKEVLKSTVVKPSVSIKLKS